MAADLAFANLKMNDRSSEIRTQCCFFSMLMPKKNRIAIYEHLFKEGVMVAKKDFHAPKHPEVEAVPNLHVIKALQVSDDKICKTVTKGETLKCWQEFLLSMRCYRTSIFPKVLCQGKSDSASGIPPRMLNILNILNLLLVKCSQTLSSSYRE